MALFKIIPDRLRKEELEYEINTRGAIPQGTVEELISKLRQLIKLEKEGHSFKTVYSYKAKDELDICQNKLTEIKQNLNEPFTSSLIKKIQSRIAHLLGRVENISSDVQDELDLRAKLLSSTLECMEGFEKKHNIYIDKSSKENPLDIEFYSSIVREGSVNTSTPVSSRSMAHRENSSSDATQITHSMHNMGITNVKISDWGLKFSGESDALGLNAFLLRVNELRESRGISTQQLFKSAVELFEGKALIYYRSLKDKISDWNTLCDIFRDEFLPRDFNERIWEQIKSRTQGDNESIAIYVACNCG